MEAARVEAGLTISSDGLSMRMLRRAKSERINDQLLPRHIPSYIAGVDVLMARRIPSHELLSTSETEEMVRFVERRDFLCLLFYLRHENKALTGLAAGSSSTLKSFSMTVSNQRKKARKPRSKGSAEGRSCGTESEMRRTGRFSAISSSSTHTQDVKESNEHKREQKILVSFPSC